MIKNILFLFFTIFNTVSAGAETPLEQATKLLQDIQNVVNDINEKIEQTVKENAQAQKELVAIVNSQEVPVENDPARIPTSRQLMPPPTAATPPATPSSSARSQNSSSRG